MFVETVFVSMQQLLLGLALCFFGFRLFVVLLPMFSFFAGFLITAQAMQELFGGGFLATISSWVFSLVIGILCAVAAYFFYYMAVAVLAAAVGFELGVGLMAGLGVAAGFVLFIVGAIVAAALCVAVLLLNVPKAFIVVLSALAGAGMILTGILLALGRISLTALTWGPVGAYIRESWFWSLGFLAIAAAGVAVQLLVPTGYIRQPYAEASTSSHAPASASPETRERGAEPAA